MATGCEGDDDVPPLEDLSEFIGQIKTLGFVEEKERVGNKSEVQQGIESEQVDIAKEDDKELKKGQVDSKINTAKSSTAKSGEENKQTARSTGETFGGFQKGFLNKKKLNTKQSKTTALIKDNTKSISSEQEKIPIICPKHSDPNDLRIPEVQEAMKTSSILQNKDWITDDLLKKIEDRPDLLKKLADPRYSQALDLFRTNPHKAWKLISENQELQIFIKEFCGILGEQFTAMADQVEQTKSEVDGRKATGSTASPADEQKMAEIMSDPETIAVLKDPWISKLVTNLKENPVEARRMLARSRPEVLPKIKKLIDAGILTFG